VDRICNDEKRDSNNTVAPNQNTMRAKNHMYDHSGQSLSLFRKHHKFLLPLIGCDCEVGQGDRGQCIWSITLPVQDLCRSYSVSVPLNS
jgi:hypothetical protein